jgi:hypothetical protein
MTLYTTPIYGIAWTDDEAPLVDLAAVSQDVAETLEAALALGGIAPPEAQDLIALTGRVVALEAPRPRAFLHQSTAQTGLLTGWQTITLQAETIDTHAGHAPGAAGYTVPAGQGGDYEVDGGVAFLGMATGLDCKVRVVVGGAVVPAGQGDRRPSSSATQTLGLGARQLTLAAGAVVTLQAHVNSGGWATAVDNAAGEHSWLSIKRVG